MAKKYEDDEEEEKGGSGDSGSSSDSDDGEKGGGYNEEETGQRAGDKGGDGDSDSGSSSENTESSEGKGGGISQTDNGIAGIEEIEKVSGVEDWVLGGHTAEEYAAAGIDITDPIWGYKAAPTTGSNVDANGRRTVTQNGSWLALVNRTTGSNFTEKNISSDTNKASGTVSESAKKNYIPGYGAIRSKGKDENGVSYVTGFDPINSITADPLSQDSWFAGEDYDHATGVEYMSRIYSIAGLTDEQRNELVSEAYEKMNTRGDSAFLPYEHATSVAIGHLNSLGLEVPEKITQEWITEQMGIYAQYATSTKNSTTGNPSTTARGKKAQIAAWLYQLQADENATVELESERDSVIQYATYLAQSPKNYSDAQMRDLIQQYIGDNCKKLGKLTSDLKDGQETQGYTRAIGWDDSFIPGVIQQARTGNSNGSLFLDTINYSLGYGKRYQPNKELSQMLDPTDTEHYQPYRVGATSNLDDEFLLMGGAKGVTFDSAWVEKNRDLMGETKKNTPQGKAYAKIAAAVTTTDTANALVTNNPNYDPNGLDDETNKPSLWQAIDRMVTDKYSYEDIISEIDGDSQWKALRDLDESTQPGKGLKATTGPINYSRQMMEQYIRDGIAKRENTENGSNTNVQNETGVLNGTGTVAGGIMESVSNAFGGVIGNGLSMIMHNGLVSVGYPEANQSTSPGIVQIGPSQQTPKSAIPAGLEGLVEQEKGWANSGSTASTTGVQPEGSAEPAGTADPEETPAATANQAESPKPAATAEPSATAEPAAPEATAAPENTNAPVQETAPKTVSNWNGSPVQTATVPAGPNQEGTKEVVVPPLSEMNSVEYSPKESGGTAHQGQSPSQQTAEPEQVSQTAVPSGMETLEAVGSTIANGVQKFLTPSSTGVTAEQGTNAAVTLSKQNLRLASKVVSKYGTAGEKKAQKYADPETTAKLSNWISALFSGKLVSEDSVKSFYNSIDRNAGENYYGAYSVTAAHDEAEARIEKNKNYIAENFPDGAPHEVFDQETISYNLQRSYSDLQVATDDLKYNQSGKSFAERREAYAAAKNEHDGWAEQWDLLKANGGKYSGTQEDIAAYNDWKTHSDAIAADEKFIEDNADAYAEADKTVKKIDGQYGMAYLYSKVCGYQRNSKDVTYYLKKAYELSTPPKIDTRGYSDFDFYAQGGMGGKDPDPVTTTKNAVSRYTQYYSLEYAAIDMILNMAGAGENKENKSISLTPDAVRGLRERQKQDDLMAHEAMYYGVRYTENFEASANLAAYGIKKNHEKKILGLFDYNSYEGMSHTDLAINQYAEDRGITGALESTGAAITIGKLNNLTDAEADTYLCLYQEYGKDIADKYFDTLIDDTYGRLTMRQYDNTVSAAEEASKTAGGALALNVLQGPASTVTNLMAGEQMLIDLFPTFDEYGANWEHVTNPKATGYIGMMAGQAVKSQTKKNIESVFGNGKIGWLANLCYDAGISGWESLNNSWLYGGAVSSLFGPEESGLAQKMISSGLSTIPMASAAAASAGLSVEEKGGTFGQKVGMCLVSFVSEWLTEVIEYNDIKKLISVGKETAGTGIKNRFLAFVKAQIPESTNEFFGEAIGELMESVGDRTILGKLGNYETNLAAYRNQMTEAEAQRQSTRDFFGGILVAGLTGALSAFMSAAPSYAMSGGSNIQNTETEEEQSGPTLRQEGIMQGAAEGQNAEFTTGFENAEATETAPANATEDATLQDLADLIREREGQAPGALKVRTPNAARIGQALFNGQTASTETAQAQAEETAQIEEQAAPAEEQTAPAEEQPAQQQNIFLVEDGSNVETAGAAMANLSEDGIAAVSAGINTLIENGISEAEAKTAAARAVLAGGNLAVELTNISEGDAKTNTRRFMRDVAKALTDKKTRRTINQKRNTWLEAQTAPEQTETAEAPVEEAPLNLKENFPGMSDDAFNTEMKTSQARVTVLSGVNNGKTNADAATMIAASLVTSEENTNGVQPAQARAAAVALCEFLGADHAASALTGMYIGGLQHGITGDEIASAVRAAALSGDANLLGLFQNFEGDVAFEQLYTFINQAENTASTQTAQNLIDEAVYNQQVQDEESRQIAETGLPQTTAAQQEADQAKTEDLAADEEVKKASDALNELFRQQNELNKQLLENPTDVNLMRKYQALLSKVAGATQNLNQMVSHKNKTKQKAAQTKTKAETTAKAELGQAHKAAIQVIDTQNSTEEAKAAIQNEQKNLQEQQKELQQSVADTMKEGGSTVAYANSGKTPVKLHFALINKSGLNVSNNWQDGSVNPNFPAELQNRNRTQTTSNAEVDSRARTLNPALLGNGAEVNGGGAPIITQTGDVVAGNGRTMSILQAMEQGLDTAKNYTQYLKEHAAEFGINAADVTEDSVLVRVLDNDNDLTPQQVMEYSNESATRGFNDHESAVNDAGKLTADILNSYDGEADLTSGKNVNFMMKFINSIIPQNQRGIYLTETNGQITGFMPKAVQRVTNALVQLAYGSDTLSKTVTEDTDPEIKTVVKSLVSASGKLAIYNLGVQNGTKADFHIAETLSQAYEVYNEIHARGISVAEALGQQSMFGENQYDNLPEEVKTCLFMFEKNLRSGKKISTAVNNLVDRANALSDPNQTQMNIDGVEQQLPTTAEFFNEAINGKQTDGKLSESDVNIDKAVELYKSQHPEATPERLQQIREALERRMQTVIDSRNNQKEKQNSELSQRQQRQQAQRNQNLANKLKERFGIKDIIIRDLGNNIKGIHHEDGTIEVNSRLNQRQLFNEVLFHELTHRIEGTKEYNDIMDFLINAKYQTTWTLAQEHKKNGTLTEQDRNLLDDVTKKYNDYIALDPNSLKSESDAIYEIVADETYDRLFSGEDDRFINALCSEKPSLAQKILDFIHDVINTLKGSNIDTTSLENTRNLFKQALEDARGKNGEQKYAIRNHKTTVDDFTQKQYDSYRWAIENGALSSYAYNQFLDSLKPGGKYKGLQRTQEGYYIFKVRRDNNTALNQLVVSDGNYENPIIYRIYNINEEFEDYAEVYRNAIIEAETSGGRDEGEAIAYYLGSQTVSVNYQENRIDYQQLRKQNRSNRSGAANSGQQQGGAGNPGSTGQSQSGVRYSLGDFEDSEFGNDGFDDGFDDDFDDEGRTGFIDDGSLMSWQNPDLHGEVNEPVRAPFADDGADTQVEIPEAFANWFSDPSGVLTNQENGKPKVFYSGEQGGMLSTRMDMNAFRQGEGGLEGARSVGKFLTNYHRAADQYADRTRKGRSIDFKPYDITNWETARAAMRDINLDLVREGKGYRIVGQDGKQVSIDGIKEGALWYGENELDKFNANYGINVANRYGARKANVSAYSLTHGAVYEGFASESNPLTIDAQGNHWDKLSPDKIIIKDKNGTLENVSAEYDTTDAWYNWAIQNGYDSVNVINVLDGNYDENGVEVPMDDIILSKPEQFKSVYNTGEYSTGTEPGTGGAMGDSRHQDIRYSLETQEEQDDAAADSLLNQLLDEAEQERTRDRTVVHRQASNVVEGQIQFYENGGLLRQLNKAAKDYAANVASEGFFKATKTAGDHMLEMFNTGIFDDLNPMLKMTYQDMDSQKAIVEELKAKQKSGVKLTNEELAIIREGSQGYTHTEDTRSMALNVRNTKFNYAEDICERALITPEGDKMYDPKTGKEYGSLYGIYQKVPASLEQEFGQYLVDLHAFDRVSNTERGAIFKSDKAGEIAARIAAAEAAHPEFKGISAELQNWYDAFYKAWRVDTGHITAEAYSRMRTLYPHYIPCYRVSNQSNPNSNSTLDRMNLKPISIETNYNQFLVGNNDTTILSPLEAQVRQIQAMVSDAKTQQAFIAFDSQNQRQDNPYVTRLADTTPTDSLMDQMNLPDGFEGSNPATTNDLIGALDARSEFQWARVEELEDGTVRTVIQVPMPDGTIHNWAVSDEGIFNGLVGLVTRDGSQSVEKVSILLSGAGKLTRLMASMNTAFNPKFVVQNFNSDGETAALTGNNHALFLTYYLRRLASTANLAKNELAGTAIGEKLGLTTDTAYDYYNREGKIGSRYYTRSEETLRDIRKKAYGKDTTATGKTKAALEHWKEVGTPKAFMEAVLSPVNKVFDGVEYLSEFLETATRYDVFRNSGFDLTTYEGRVKAAEAARNSTVDFSKKGSANIMREMGVIVPFVRATLQGQYKTLRMFSRENEGHRAQMVGNMLANGVIMGAMGALLRNLSWTPDEKEAYDQMSDYERNKYWHIKIPGTDTIVKIKNSQDGAIQAAKNFGEFLVDCTSGYDMDDASQFVGCMSEALSAFAVPTDTVFDPWMDAMRNKTYYDSSINGYLYDNSKTLPEDMDTAHESSLPVFSLLAHTLADVTGGGSNASVQVSPMQLQYIATQFFGSMGEVTFDIMGGESILDALNDEMLSKFCYDPIKSANCTSTFYDNRDVLKGIVDSHKNGDTCSFLKRGYTPAEYSAAAREAKTLYEGYMTDTSTELKKLWNQYNKKAAAGADEETLKQIRMKINRKALAANERVAKFHSKYGRQSIGENIANGMVDVIGGITGIYPEDYDEEEAR